MIKKTALILAIILSLGLLYNLSRQIYESLEAGKRLDTEAENLTKLQKQNSELKTKLADANSLQFIEQQARDKLNLARPGESVFVIPQAEIDKVLGATKQEVEKKVEPYWQGWLKLFLH